jgi:hypothetical protein
MRQRPRWHYYLAAISVLLLLYAAGYFLLMNVHLPTSPYRNSNDYFESSFRWASHTRASKDNTGLETPFPEVTIWNVIYWPMDKLYFRMATRSPEEVDKLKALGYYR